MVNSINYLNQHLKGMEKMKIKYKISYPFPNFLFPPPNDAESHDDQNQQRDNDGHNNACCWRESMYCSGSFDIRHEYEYL